MSSEVDKPTWERVIVGLLVAPLTSAWAMGLAQPFNAGGPSGAEDYWRTFVLYVIGGSLIGLPISIVGGGVAYSVLSARVTPTVLISIVVGSLLAASPALAISLLALLAAARHGDWRDPDYGAWSAAVLGLPLAGFGAIGGLAFWLTVFWAPTSTPDA